MAKYTITNTCGHDYEYNLFGPGRDRDRKIAWLEGQACLRCRRAAEAKDLADKVAAAKAMAANEGWPTLHGEHLDGAEWHRAEVFTKLAQVTKAGIAYDRDNGHAEADAELAGIVAKLEESPLDRATWSALADRLAESPVKPVGLNWIRRESGADRAPSVAAVAKMLGIADAAFWVGVGSSGLGYAITCAAKSDEEAAEAAKRRQAEVEAAARKKAEEQAEAAKKAEAAAALRAKIVAAGERFRDFLGGFVTEVSLGEWSGSRRIYFGHGYGANVGTYWITADARHDAGELELKPKSTAKVGDRMGEFKEFLASLGQAWNSLHIKLDDKGVWR